MKKCWLFCLLLVGCSTNLVKQPKTYSFSNDPIDVVIPCREKDLVTLLDCIDGIRKYGENIRRVIVVSDKPLTDKAEWFDEKKFPFSKEDIVRIMVRSKKQVRINKYFHSPRSGWVLQQLLKLYAYKVIPNLSSNVLLLDSDTVFINPVSFTGEDNAGLLNIGREYHKPYFAHAGRLIPGLKRLKKRWSGICHHMLVQKPVLDDLFNTVETYHKNPFWQVFCRKIDKKELYGSGASEYEIYFNFALKRSEQLQVRKLKWAEITRLDEMDKYKKLGYHYISNHFYLREQN